MAIPYPFNPDWSQPYSFSKTFKTGRSVSRGQLRQRAALRSEPLATIEYVSQFKGVENSAIVHRLRNNKTALFDVPDWRIARPVTDIASLPATDSAMATTSYVEFEITDRTDYQPIEAGDKVMVWQSPSVFFVGTVDASAFDAETITLELDAEYSLGSSDSPASADPIYCFKVFTCYPDSVNLQWPTDQVCEAAIRWTEASETPLSGVVGELDLREEPEGPDDGGQICEPALIDSDYLAIPVFDVPCSNPSEERPAFRAKDAAMPATFFIRFDRDQLSQTAGHPYSGTLDNLIDLLDSTTWECVFQDSFASAVSTSRHWHHIKAANDWSKGTPTVQRWLWKAEAEYEGDDGGTYTCEVRVCIEHDTSQSPDRDDLIAKLGAWGCLFNIHVFSDEIASYTDGTTAGDGRVYYRDDPCIGDDAAPWKYGHPQLVLTHHYRTSLTAGCTQTAELFPNEPEPVSIGNPWDGALNDDARFNSCYGQSVGVASYLPIGMVHYGEGAWDVQLKEPGMSRFEFEFGGDANNATALTDAGGGCYTDGCMQVPDSQLSGLTKYAGTGSDVGDFDGCEGHESYAIGGTSRTIMVPDDWVEGVGGVCYDVAKISTASVRLVETIDRRRNQVDRDGNFCYNGCPVFDNPYIGAENYGLSLSRLVYDWTRYDLNRKQFQWQYREEQDWQNTGSPYTAFYTVTLYDEGWRAARDIELTPMFRDDPDIDALSIPPIFCNDPDLPPPGCPCETLALVFYNSFEIDMGLAPQSIPNDFRCPPFDANRGQSVATDFYPNYSTTTEAIWDRLQWTGKGIDGDPLCNAGIMECGTNYPSSPLQTTILTVSDNIDDVEQTAKTTAEQPIGSKGVSQWALLFHQYGFDGLGEDCCNQG
jgi:hypothetical protein